mmetsp:Transcript_99404/g.171146  ORF Transcript_99404/g.171146 Transcript_99404/m.171146 type:complete len:140 (-) Transcript_99404:8-427(-)
MCTFLGHCIAALSPNIEVGNAIGPGIASWMSSFAGFYLPLTSIPTAYLWIYWLNPFRWVYESMMVNMFDGQTIQCTPSQYVKSSTGQMVCPITSGTDVILNMGLQPGWYWLDQLVIALYMGGFSLATLLCLHFLRFGTR